MFKEVPRRMLCEDRVGYKHASRSGEEKRTVPMQRYQAERQLGRCEGGRSIQLIRQYFGVESVVCELGDRL